MELQNLWCPYIICTCTGLAKLTSLLNSHEHFFTLKILSLHRLHGVFRLPNELCWFTRLMLRSQAFFSPNDRRSRCGPAAEAWPFVNRGVTALCGISSQRRTGSRALGGSGRNQPASFSRQAGRLALLPGAASLWGHTFLLLLFRKGSG